MLTLICFILFFGHHNGHNTTLALKKSLVTKALKHGIGSSPFPVKFLFTHTDKLRGGDFLCVPYDMGKVLLERTQTYFFHFIHPSICLYLVDKYILEFLSINVNNLSIEKIKSAEYTKFCRYVYAKQIIKLCVDTWLCAC